jgi:murein DD-endopeptidase MepM/ murein hydrolase activator NlpD
MKKKLFAILTLISLSSWMGGFSIARAQQEDYDSEIQGLNQQIQSQNQQLEAIKQSQKQYADKIKSTQNQKATLSNELQILSDGVEKTKLEIEANQLEINKTDLEIKKANIDISNENDAIDKEKTNISGLLKLLYKQQDVSTLEVLLLNNSLADFVNQAHYLQNTNKELANSLDSLKKDKAALENNRALLTEKEKSLTDLQASLGQKQAVLEQNQQDQTYILEETKQSERRYQALLKEAQLQEQQTNNEIFSLEKTVRDKLSASKQKRLAASSSGFIWPVPKNYITTTFHDPDYPFRKLIGEHPGVDIRASQGTALMAAAAGYVARVKFDGSRNYAYIMIIHADGLSTVYGHVSAVNVEADDYVSQGQVIGKTGGLPGSVGAGPFTTGAHLHFEVRKDGIPVDPLGYLP